MESLAVAGEKAGRKLGLEVIASGRVYRNPKPYLRSIHAIHPSLLVVSETEMVVTFDIGEGPESMDYHTVLARSKDAGLTWELEGRILTQEPERKSTHSIRTTLLSSGRVFGIGAFYYRDDEEEGIFNRQNLGLVPMDLFVISSDDLGRTWSEPRIVQPPIASPAWEASHAPLELDGGRIGIPLSTWRGWDGDLSCGQQSVVIFSEDGGATWPRYSRTFDGRLTGFIHWEQCVIERDGDLLAVAWEYDSREEKSRPSVFSTGVGFPPSFAPAAPTGFLGETCEILALDDWSVLAVYRRADQPGLWATIAHVRDGVWRNQLSLPLWTGSGSRMASASNGADGLSDLKFGSPSMKMLPDGSILVVFWCHEDGVSNIRWIKLGIDRSHVG